MPNQGPLKEAPKEDAKLQAYLTRMQDRAAEIAPYLARVDVEALKRVEESFQCEMHEGIYALRFEDQAAVMETLGWIKGARALMVWIERKKKAVEGI